MPDGWKKDKVYLQLKQKILSGEFTPGMRLPKELEFSRELNVAKVTLRSALARLESEGLVERLPSKGTFVAGDTAANLILIVIPQQAGLHYPCQYIAPGITAAAAAAGYRVDFCFVEYLRELGTVKAVDYLKRKKLFGTLLIDSTYLGHEPELEIFHRLGLPLLLIHPKMNDHVVTGFSSLVTDTRQAWRSGLEHLAGNGYENVRILEQQNGLREWDALEYSALFRKLGLNHEGRLSYYAEMDNDSIAEGVKILLRENPDVQAVYCYSDFYAIKVMKALKAMNFQIPEDIAVMGYCGYPGNVMLDPPLSTVDLGYMNIGRMAVDLLPRCQEGNPERYFSPYQVIGRKSTDNPALLRIMNVNF